MKKFFYLILLLVFSVNLFASSNFKWIASNKKFFNLLLKKVEFIKHKVYLYAGSSKATKELHKLLEIFKSRLIVIRNGKNKLLVTPGSFTGKILKCKLCHATGYYKGKICPACNGDGYVFYPGNDNPKPCAFCHGTGLFKGKVCPACHGAGWAYYLPDPK